MEEEKVDWRFYGEVVALSFAMILAVFFVISISLSIIFKRESDLFRREEIRDIRYFCSSQPMDKFDSCVDEHVKIFDKHHK